MKVEVLISCMHQKDTSIIRNTNIQSDALVINQCDENRSEEFISINKDGDECKIRMFSTTERGLSRSRNMAIKNAGGDICLICDDDEQLEPEYSKIILDAFYNNPQADLIAFWVDIPSKRGKKIKRMKRLGYIDALKISSVQIAFRRESIINHAIKFDELMGSGTGNGGGEEVKFLFDCLRDNLNIIYIPQTIGAVSQTKSVWFHGFTPQFMRNQGWSSRRIMGIFWGYIYIVLFLIRKYHLYKNDCSFIQALKEIHIGFFEKRI